MPYCKDNVSDFSQYYNDCLSPAEPNPSLNPALQLVDTSVFSLYAGIGNTRVTTTSSMPSLSQTLGPIITVTEAPNAVDDQPKSDVATPYENPLGRGP